MNTELGAFTLRQVLASTSVMGPILILVGLCYYIFKQDRKSVILYLGAGAVLTLIGVACLYSEFKTEQRQENRGAEAEASTLSESAKK